MDVAQECTLWYSLEEKVIMMIMTLPEKLFISSLSQNSWFTELPHHTLRFWKQKLDFYKINWRRLVAHFLQLHY